MDSSGAEGRFPGGIRGWLAARPLAVDVLIAVGLTALSLIIIASGAQDLGSYDPLSLILLVLQTLPLVFRRRFPVAVLLVRVILRGLAALLAQAKGLSRSPPSGP